MFGTMGRNTLHGPGRNNWDMALLKNFVFPWGDRTMLQFRIWRPITLLTILNLKPFKPVAGARRPMDRRAMARKTWVTDKSPALGLRVRFSSV